MALFSPIAPDVRVPDSLAQLGQRLRAALTETTDLVQYSVDVPDLCCDLHADSYGDTLTGFDDYEVTQLAVAAWCAVAGADQDGDVVDAANWLLCGYDSAMENAANMRDALAKARVWLVVVADPKVELVVEKVAEQLRETYSAGYQISEPAALSEGTVQLFIAHEDSEDGFDEAYVRPLTEQEALAFVTSAVGS